MTMVPPSTCFLWRALLVVSILVWHTAGAAEKQQQEPPPQEQPGQRFKEMEAYKLDLWTRGGVVVSTNNASLIEQTWTLQNQVAWVPKLGPIQSVRRRQRASFHRPKEENIEWWQTLRGGATVVDQEENIQRLRQTLGPDFIDAIEQNKRDHKADCEQSCRMYFCATPETPLPSMEEILHNGTTHIHSYSMGSVPPEDFASEFGFPLDLIKVTAESPLFSAREAAHVIQQAEAEGVDRNEYKSGKYKLGGDWLTNLPNTRAWFNEKLQTTLFPLVTHLFPQVIKDPSVLRAHSVSLLKYNASHPRTDVHVDNGILAMTLAMTPKKDYQGGGTFFEHMGAEHVLEMDVGHGTFRPGSVRHGGHRVQRGTRYILGAFLLLEDRVEHVRRLKNRGSELRSAGDLAGAERYFEWALALNPQCTTCLKDWAEILQTRKEFSKAEAKIRTALELLENKDSDALFTLGVLLSEQGRDDESIEAYQQSVALNAEDAELCYNLGIKLGAKGKVQEEMAMYARATLVDTSFGGAWLNWGTALAEMGNLDDAEVMFLKAVQCEAEVAPKAMVNLGLVYQSKANELAVSGNLGGAKEIATKAAQFLDSAKPLLEQLIASQNADATRYMQQFKPLRLQCHRLIGQIYAGLGDHSSCEGEFRSAVESFPNEASAWQMLARILDMQGKSQEAKEMLQKAQSLTL